MDFGDEVDIAASTAVGNDGRDGCIGVVLAGGRSSRMGRDKAALEVAGEPLLRRVVGRLREALGEVVVVGPAELQALVPGVRVVPDDLPGAGPLGALGAVLHAVPAERLFLAGCDMPFVAPELVRAMTKLAVASPEVDVLLLRSPTGRQYLHAVYARTCLPTLERLLADSERSLRSLVEAIRVREVPLELAARYDPLGRSAFNANTREEWEWARDIVDRERGGA